MILLSSLVFMSTVSDLGTKLNWIHSSNFRIRYSFSFISIVFVKSTRKTYKSTRKKYKTKMTLRVRTRAQITTIEAGLSVVKKSNSDFNTVDIYHLHNLHTHVASLFRCLRLM